MELFHAKDLEMNHESIDIMITCLHDFTCVYTMQYIIFLGDEILAHFFKCVFLLLFAARIP